MTPAADVVVENASRLMPGLRNPRPRHNARWGFCRRQDLSQAYRGQAHQKDGTPRSPKKLGKIHFPVFTPGGTRVVGFMVRQSDIAGMIERPDRFVALDAIGVYEGAIAVDDVKGTYDTAAAKRLDINLDDCIIWVGMDVRTESGDVVGYCSDVSSSRARASCRHSM